MKSSKRSGFAPIIILIIVVLLAGVYFYFKTQNHNETANNLVPASPVTTIEPSPTPLNLPFVALNDYSKETVGWETHNLGEITFQTPKNWTVNWNRSEIYSLQSLDMRLEQGVRGIQAGTYLEIRFRQEKFTLSGLSLQERAADLVDHTTQLISSTTIGGVDAIKYTTNCCENHNTIIGIIFIKNGDEYIIEQSYKYNGNNPYPNLLEQVASTVKFK